MSNNPKQTLRDISTRLRQARDLVGINQQKMAESLGVSTQRLNNWEKGRSSIDHYHAQKYRELFGISLDWLIAGDLAALPFEKMQKLLNETDTGPSPDHKPAEKQG